MSLPPVVLSLTLMVGFGTGVGNVILSIVLVDWTRFCRVVRSEVIVVRRKDFVVGGEAPGLRRHSHHPARNPAERRAADHHAVHAAGRHRRHRRSDPELRGLERSGGRAGLGHDDRRRPQLHVPGALGHRSCRSSRCSSRCSASICWARACASRSIRGCASGASDDERAVLRQSHGHGAHRRPQRRRAARSFRSRSGRARSSGSSANPAPARA